MKMNIIRTFDDLIREKDYDYVEIRTFLPVKTTHLKSVVVSRGSVENGKFICLEGDSCALDTRIFDFYEFVSPSRGIKAGVIVRISRKDAFKEVKEMKTCDLVTCTANENGKCANRGYADSCPYAKCKRIIEDIREYVDRYDEKGERK